MRSEKVTINLLLIFSLSSFVSLKASRMPDQYFIDVHHYLYEEPGIMREQSNLPGLIFGCDNYQHFANSFELDQLGYRFELGGGQMRYVGSGMTSSVYIKSLIELYAPLSSPFTEPHNQYQGAYKFYLGLGYRNLLDHPLQQCTSSGHHTYIRSSQYFYMPVGMSLSTPWLGRCNLQYNFFFKGRQISFLNLIFENANKVIHDQSQGYGGHISYIWPDGRRSCYLCYWRIENSNVGVMILDGHSYRVLEPQNFTMELGWRYSF